MGTPHHGQFSLLRERRFAPLFATQFLGAANDNLFKYAFTLLVTDHAAQFTPLAPALAVMMGLHSTLFGPAKYAYPPQVLRGDEIVGGNGLVETGIFVAILFGTIVAGALVEAGPDGPRYAAAATLLLALAGLAASIAIPPAPAADPRLTIDWNPLRAAWATVQGARRSRAVFLSLLGISWLWFFGAVFLTQFPQFAQRTLGGAPAVATLLLTVFSVGIGVGSPLCERMSRGQVEIGLGPFGSIGMTLFTVDLFFAIDGLPVAAGLGIGQFLGHGAHWRVLADLALLAMFAGFYSVPLYALIQTRAAATHKARVIAANNILNALFLVLAAALGALALGLAIPQLFLLTALLNAAVAVYIYALVPEFLLRFLSWLLVSTAYRVVKRGTERIPAEGPALLVANHVSFVDARVLIAASPRPIRFVMDAGIFRIPVLSWLFRQAKAIPIASAKVDPALMERAFEEVSEALRDGQLVCIFPEGRITDTGDLYPFRPGVTRILQRDPVSVMPVALQGLWGSFFSRAGGAAMRWPFRRGLFNRIGIHVGETVEPARAAPALLQAQVAELRGGWR